MALKPFMRWVGGKSWVNIESKVVGGAYCEPFLGSGAWLIEAMSSGRLEAGKIVVGDLAQESHVVWMGVLANPVRVAVEATRFIARVMNGDVGSRASVYDDLVSEWNGRKPTAKNTSGRELSELAGLALAINRMSFKGLVRTNRVGAFNASYGHLPNPSLDQAMVIAVGREMARLDVVVIPGRWEETVQTAIHVGPGLLAVDPPYAGTTHTRYTERGWDGRDRVSLSHNCKMMCDAGWSVLITDDNTHGSREAWAWADPAPTTRNGGMGDGSGSGRNERSEIMAFKLGHECGKIQ